MTFKGKLTYLSYYCRVAVTPYGKKAKMSINDSALTITKADSLLVLLSGGTNYSTETANYRTNESVLHQRIDDIINKALAKNYTTLKTRQQKATVCFSTAASCLSHPTTVTPNRHRSL